MLIKDIVNESWIDLFSINPDKARARFGEILNYVMASLNSGDIHRDATDEFIPIGTKISRHGFSVRNIPHMKNAEVGFISNKNTKNLGYSNKNGVYLFVNNADTAQDALFALGFDSVKNTMYHEYIHYLQLNKWLGRPRVDVSDPGNPIEWASRAHEAEAIINEALSIIHSRIDAATEMKDIERYWDADLDAWTQKLKAVIVTSIMESGVDADIITAEGVATAAVNAKPSIVKRAHGKLAKAIKDKKLI